MKLYNGLTNQVEQFEPLGEAVTIYVCGITPYDTTHLGHAFTYASADLLIRYLEYKGYPVQYVQNVTDIDDDIMRKSKEAGEDWVSLGNRWTAHFIRDMINLNVRPPDAYPRATDVIPEIVDTVARLVESGVGYHVAGNVYFSIKAWEAFGKLSGLTYDEMLPIANERGNFPDDPHKRDPLDFVLWQAQVGDEPSWHSPWGQGRPGWHIECSTMAGKYLGKTIDIHSGGADLEFPHHECEIAQAEAVNAEHPFSRFWLHAAMVYHEGEKMSKSLGNLVMVRDLLQEWTPDALRLYLGSYRYRESWSHDETRLTEMARLADQVLAALQTQTHQEPPASQTEFLVKFEEAMENDLNTPEGIRVMQDLSAKILEMGQAGDVPAGLVQALRNMGQVFGLQLEQGGPNASVREGWNNHLKRFMD